MRLFNVKALFAFGLFAGFMGCVEVESNPDDEKSHRLLKVFLFVDLDPSQV